MEEDFIRLSMKHILLLVSVIFLWNIQCQGHKYFVASTGNDMNDGSFNTPWLSISHGSNLLSPGDTLVVKSGLYNSLERETISN